MSGLPIKVTNIYSVRGPDVVFVVESIWNDWVKKDGINANLVLCDWPNFRYLH